MPYLVSIAFPSTGHPDPIRALRHPWLACRDTNKVLIDYRCCLQACSTTLLKPLLCADLFSSICL